MSTRTVTYKICNGCHRNEPEDGVSIIESKPYEQFAEIQLSEGRTIDICADCAEAGRYICGFCRSVHDDEHPCEVVALRLKAAVRSA